MVKREFYYVPVDKNNRWTPCNYRKVTCEELDKILQVYREEILKMCKNGSQGAMTMWAYFKNVTCSDCYGDMVNAYSLLSNDHKSLVTREHEFRHMWNNYQELWRIRYFGTLEEYYLKKAAEAKERMEKYCNE